MPIITISRGSFSRGEEIAKKVAEKLEFECVSREILLEASEEFNIPQVKLVHALEDAPGFFDRFTHRKEKYVAYIESALLRHLKKDNVVYHGFAGHFFVKDISHVLKVRIIAEMEDRIEFVMARDKVSREEAARFIEKLDEQRRKWGEHLYGIDTHEPGLYDLVIHINKIKVHDASSMICDAASLRQFQATPESQKAIDDLALAAEVKAALIDIKSDIRVSADDGTVTVHTEAPLVQEVALIQEITKTTQTIPGVKETKVDVRPLDLA